MTWPNTSGQIWSAKNLQLLHTPIDSNFLLEWSQIKSLKESYLVFDNRRKQRLHYISTSSLNDREGLVFLKPEIWKDASALKIECLSNVSKIASATRCQKRIPFELIGMHLDRIEAVFIQNTALSLGNKLSKAAPENLQNEHKVATVCSSCTARNFSELLWDKFLVHEFIAKK